MKILIRAIFPILILVIGFLAFKWLGIPVEEPTPEVSERQKLQTEKSVLNPTAYNVVIESQGSIQTQQSTTITPLVSGTVVKIHPAFEDGAFFKKGEVLLELDPADLETAVFSSESELARAEATLIRQRALEKQALLNWQDIGYEEEPSALVLRIPQLREAEADVSSAKANLEQARRNLDRASVRAPFDGRVDERMVGLGQAVNATTQLGKVFGTATAEIRLPLAPSQLAFINLPATASDAPVDVILTDALQDPSLPSQHQWSAKIVRTEGTLDPNSRELFAIAIIHDPFSLTTDLPQLRIGQPMRAAIDGITLDDVFVIPRTAMRGLNQIFLIDKEDQDNLKIMKKDITPVWSNRDVLIVRNDLSPGDWLATSRLRYTPNGAPVEILTAAADGQVIAPPSANVTPSDS